MIRICVIGGIGSGKTFVSKLFRFPVLMQMMRLEIFIKKIRNALKN